MKKIIIVAVAVVLLGAAAYAFLAGKREDGVSYRFVPLERGDLEEIVSATGTLSAVTTVQVGTQISGLIAGLYADFNDQVAKGQVIAQLDTTLLASALQDVEASLERSRVELRQAERDYERVATLHKDGISADADFNKAQYNLEMAQASVKSATASLARARQNLSYATITAPVSGTVVQRSVDVGQTVAASLSAPNLFLIANDLSRMQILASVDESDIGRIKEGQQVRFTVKAWPDRTFQGEVKQVRLQSASEQNIVSYTVVIDVANPDRSLLPGMTATVEFQIAKAEDVLKVANAALRFRATEAMMAEVRARRERERAQAGGQAGEGAGTRGGMGSGAGMLGAQGGGSGQRANGRRPDFAMLWFLDPDGTLNARPVRPGITDGQFTEVRGRDLEEGLQVIAGMTQKASAGASVNPFSPQSSQQQRRMPGPGF